MKWDFSAFIFYLMLLSKVLIISHLFFNEKFKVIENSTFFIKLTFDQYFYSHILYEFRITGKKEKLWLDHGEDRNIIFI